MLTQVTISDLQAFCWHKIVASVTLKCSRRRMPSSFTVAIISPEASLDINYSHFIVLNSRRGTCDIIIDKVCSPKRYPMIIPSPDWINFSKFDVRSQETLEPTHE